MNNLAKPIIIGALLIAIGVYLGAQSIANELSFEGRWDSCVKTFSSDKIQNLFNKNLVVTAEQLATTMCMRMGKADEP